MQLAPELVQQIQTLFHDEFSIRIGSMDFETDLVQKGILDSVAIVRLAAALDKRFQIRIPIESLVLDAPCSIVNIARLTAECMREAAGGGRPEIPAEPMDQVRGQIEALLVEKLAIRVESDTTDLFQTGILDSMTLVQLVLALEERFGIELPVEQIEAEAFSTVARIAETVAAAGARSRRVSSDSAGGL
jgi:D-alanine--poly(phosphoribitol) ligase subunit 2